MGEVITTLPRINVKNIYMKQLRKVKLLSQSDNIITAPSLKPLPKSLPAVSFMHSTVLDQEGSVVMLWTPTEEDIVFEIQVRRKKYH